jgi:alpha-methylacyl-CoA racemase
MSLPLEGLRVLDLSRLLPGPYASLVLADLGAAVDKLADPRGGDYIRQMPPMRGEDSALFLTLNRNKRSIVLDLKSPSGAAALKQLSRHYDVLLESFRPGVMDRLGLGFAALHEVNPRLVYCAISGYGQTGPDRLRAGHDLNYAARSGVLGYGGARGGTPGLPGVQVGDVGGGSLFALVGILAALHERARTGTGRLVDVSMTDGMLAFLHMHLGARMLMGEQGRPLERGAETLNGGYPCYGLYRTRDDRWMAVGALEPKFCQGLCDALGLPDALPGAYDTGALGQATRERFEAAFATRTREAWTQVFRALDVCVEPVWEGDEVLSDPQLLARGMFAEGSNLSTPLRFGALRLQPAPALGEHTQAVLEEAGFTPEQIAQLATKA